jgi:hypothetical protein
MTMRISGRFSEGSLSMPGARAVCELAVVCLLGATAPGCSGDGEALPSSLIGRAPLAEPVGTDPLRVGGALPEASDDETTARAAQVPGGGAETSPAEGDADDTSSSGMAAAGGAAPECAGPSCDGDDVELGTAECYADRTGLLRCRCSADENSSCRDSGPQLQNMTCTLDEAAGEWICAATSRAAELAGSEAECYLEATQRRLICWLEQPREALVAGSEPDCYFDAGVGAFVCYFPEAP